MLAIKVQAEAALGAGDLAAFLPQHMAAMALMWMSVWHIHTLPGNKGLEGAFIASFVDIGATLDTA